MTFCRVVLLSPTEFVPLLTTTVDDELLTMDVVANLGHMA